MKGKQLLACAVAAAAVMGTSAVQAQIPVTDVANITQNAMAHVEDIAKYVQQIQQMKMQVEQMKQQYKALTGSRGLGEIFNNPAMSQFVPNDYQSLYNAIRNGNVQGITSVTQDMAQDNSGSIADLSQELKARQAHQAGTDLGLAMKAYDANIDRMNNLQDLMSRINGAQDMKAAADLGNRIAVEQAIVNNEAAKLRLVAMIQQAQREAQAHKAEVIWNKQMTMEDNLPRLPANLTVAH